MLATPSVSVTWLLWRKMPVAPAPSTSAAGSCAASGALIARARIAVARRTAAKSTGSPSATSIASGCCIVEYSSGERVRAGRRDGALGVDEIEHAHAVELGRRPRGPARVVQRLHDVRMARRPVLAHREARELIVLGVVFVALGAVDELHDVEAHAVRTQKVRYLSRVRIVSELRRQLGE